MKFENLCDGGVLLHYWRVVSKSLSTNKGRGEARSCGILVYAMLAIQQPEEMVETSAEQTQYLQYRGNNIRRVIPREGIPNSWVLKIDEWPFLQVPISLSGAPSCKSPATTRFWSTEVRRHGISNQSHLVMAISEVPPLESRSGKVSGDRSWDISTVHVGKHFVISPERGGFSKWCSIEAVGADLRL